MRSLIQTAEKGNECCQSLCNASGAGCVLSDKEGNVISGAGFTCENCGLCGSIGVSAREKVRIFSFAVSAAEKSGGRHMYTCPVGFSFITAVVMDGKDRAGLTLGPVILEDLDYFLSTEVNIRYRSNEEVFDGISTVAKELSVLDASKLSSFSVLAMCSAAYLSEPDDYSYETRLETQDMQNWIEETKVDSGSLSQEISAYITENFVRDITLAELAEKFGISTSYLCRVFKKETGLTVNAFLNNLRIENSRQLLRQGVDIAETARLCGFSDQSYFTKVFRMSEGITPLKYRKEYVK